MTRLQRMRTVSLNKLYILDRDGSSYIISPYTPWDCHICRPIEPLAPPLAVSWQSGLAVPNRSSLGSGTNPREILLRRVARPCSKKSITANCADGQVPQSSMITKPPVGTKTVMRRVSLGSSGGSRPFRLATPVGIESKRELCNKESQPPTRSSSSLWLLLYVWGGIRLKPPRIAPTHRIRSYGDQVLSWTCRPCGMPTNQIDQTPRLRWCMSFFEMFEGVSFRRNRLVMHARPQACCYDELII